MRPSDAEAACKRLESGDLRSWQPDDLRLVIAAARASVDLWTDREMRDDRIRELEQQLAAERQAHEQSPTAWAYEQCCKARDKWQAKCEQAERALTDAKRDALYWLQEHAYAEAARKTACDEAEEADARAEEAERESEGRRVQLERIGEERRTEWIRAENAEARVAQLETALREIAETVGPSAAAYRLIARRALAGGEGEK